MNVYRFHGKKSRLPRLFPCIFESMESRQLLSTISLLGSSGDDRIVITFDAMTGAATVTGAANVADGSVFAKTDYFDIDAGDGNDYVEFAPASGAAVEYPFSGNNSTVRGGSGDDTIIISSAGDVDLDGGPGNDHIVARSNRGGFFALGFSDTLHGVRVRLDKGMVYDDGFGGHDSISGIRAVSGTRFDDILYGAENTNYIAGREGNDLLVATGSSGMQLYGEEGDDTLRGDASSGLNAFAPGQGNDIVIGGDKPDTLRYYDDEVTRGVVVRLGRGLVKDGSGGIDHISSIENVEVYSNFNDTIYGDAADNALYGGGGIDMIFGLGGDDHIVIDQGIVLAGAGNDVIATNSSLVYIDGGQGRDQIAMWGPKFAIERIILDPEDSISDNRYEPDSSQMSPGPNTLQAPDRTRARPMLDWNCFECRWVLK